MTIKNNYFQKIKKALLQASSKNVSLLSFAFAFIFLVSLFLITRGITPHTSELSYIEHSVLGQSSGSVIPASCDSAAPHDGEVCGAWVAGACPAWNSNTAVSTYVPFTCVGGNSGCSSPQPNPLFCEAKPYPPSVAIKLGGPIGTQQATFTNTPPTIETFITSAATVDAGSTARLDWRAKNAGRCLLKVNQNGIQIYEVIVNPDTITTNNPFVMSANTTYYDRNRSYVLTCSNSAGQTVTAPTIFVYFYGKIYTPPGCKWPELCTPQ